MKNTTETTQAQQNCQPTDHMFTHVEITAATANPYNGLASYPTAPGRSFKLYCGKCGEVRPL
jgi:hypothetical protein